MSRTRAGEEPGPSPALVMVYPLPTAFVQGEPHIPHEVTPDRAAELVGAPIPAFSLTPPDEEAVIHAPASAGSVTED